MMRLTIALAALSLRAAEIDRITVEPRAAAVQGPGESHQFLVTAHYAEGGVRDVTREARYAIQDPGVAKAVGPGNLTAVAEGVTQIEIQLEGRKTRAAFVVHPARGKTWEFANDIAPIFSKYGCNNNACHGALNGQNGFKLSLFGYDPAADHEAIVSQGKRLDRTNPAKSLLLQKPVFELSHGGGHLFSKDSHDYRILHDWISDGAPLGSGTAPG